MREIVGDVLQNLKIQRAILQRAAMKLRAENGDPEIIRQLDELQLQLKQRYYECGGEHYDPTVYWNMPF